MIVNVAEKVKFISLYVGELIPMNYLWFCSDLIQPIIEVRVRFVLTQD